MDPDETLAAARREMGDADGRPRSERLQAGQARVLEMVARSAPLAETLEALTLLIEAQSEGLYCSVLLLDEDGIHVHPGAGPHLPATYMQALDGYPIGPVCGSCGTAMYRREPVIVCDILSDPLWADYKMLVEPHGFRACWSTPIFLERDTVLGSFAMYYKEVRSPGPEDTELIGVATHLAGIAIERTRREEQLRRHRDHLEQLVQERTAQLVDAKERAEAGVTALSEANHELAAALHSLSRAQEELVRSKKLAALGSLVAGIAHELNTPIGNSLMAISTLADRREQLAALLGAGTVKRSALDAFLDDVREASDILSRNLQRAAGLIDSFKQISVEQPRSARRRFMLDELVAETMLHVQGALDRRGIAVRQDIPSGIVFDSYPGSLAQALVGLTDNAAAHAFGERGGEIAIVARIADDGRVALSVRDDGAGIAPEHLDRIFDPFFTTRLAAGNCGLGLNVIHNIVSGILGGGIAVDSAPARGTTVTLTLPVEAPGGE